MPDPETARALLAGLIAGVATAFATTAIALISIARDERWYARTARMRLPLPLLGVIVVNGLMLGCTLLGLVLAAAYLRAEDVYPAGGVGSPNRLFTLLIAGAAAVLLLGVAVVRRRLTWPMWATALVALLAFGWLLPGLAR